MVGPDTAESIASPKGLSLHVPGTLADLSWPYISVLALRSGGRPGIVATILSIMSMCEVNWYVRESAHSAAYMILAVVLSFNSGTLMFLLLSSDPPRWLPLMMAVSLSEVAERPAARAWSFESLRLPVEVDVADRGQSLYLFSDSILSSLTLPCIWKMVSLLAVRLVLGLPKSLGELGTNSLYLHCSCQWSLFHSLAKHFRTNRLPRECIRQCEVKAVVSMKVWASLV